MPSWVHVIAWGGTALVAALVLVLQAVIGDTDPWRDWTPSNELLAPVYAERTTVHALLRTPVNTWSNLGFVLVGLYIIGLAWVDRREPGAGHVRRTPPLSLLYGATVVALGLASGLFHASMTRVGQQLDVAGMYAPLLALLAISAGRAGAPWPPLVAGVALASGALFALKWLLSAWVVLPVLIALCLVARAVERLRGQRVHLGWLALTAASLIVAFACRQADAHGRFSGPDDWWQGHAVWHLLCAVSLGAAYLEQRGDARPDAERA